VRIRISFLLELDDRSMGRVAPSIYSRCQGNLLSVDDTKVIPAAPIQIHGCWVLECPRSFEKPGSLSRSDLKFPKRHAGL